MNGTQVLWLGVALVNVVVVLLLALRTVRRQPAQPSRGARTAWLVAATTSGTVLILIVAKVGDLIPNSTPVDVAALAVTGVLTGVFLTLGLKPTAGNGVS